MAADTTAIMAGIAEQLDTITGLRVYAYPPDSIAVPAAVVAFPDTVEYDTTMARGADRVVVPVHVLVGKVSDRASSPALTTYMAGEGLGSVKTAIEADKTLSGEAQTTRVTEAAVSVIALAGVDYLAATFQVEVVA